MTCMNLSHHQIKHDLTNMIQFWSCNLYLTTCLRYFAQEEGGNKKSRAGYVCKVKAGCVPRVEGIGDNPERNKHNGEWVRLGKEMIITNKTDGPGMTPPVPKKKKKDTASIIILIKH